MISIILSSRLLIILLYQLLGINSSNVFFISVIIFFSYDWLFFIFSGSLKKLSLCSSLLFCNSVIILITNNLISFSGKLLVSLFVFFRVFLLLFQLSPISLSPHFV